MTILVNMPDKAEAKQSRKEEKNVSQNNCDSRSAATTAREINVDRSMAKSIKIDINENLMSNIPLSSEDQRSSNTSYAEPTPTVTPIPFALFDTDFEVDSIVESSPDKVYHWDIVWSNVILIALLHVLAIGGLVVVPTAHNATIGLGFLVIILTMIGVQAGAHRLWTHRSYKANFGVRLFLCICETLASQTNIYRWVRDHRVHHKWSETDADPHNSRRGFFFSHVGWLMVKKQPEVYAKGRTIDMSDIEADPICVWQKRLFYPAMFVLWAVLPTAIPVFAWNEIAATAFIVAVIQPYLMTLHATWMVNSWAHMFGSKPYNTKIGPVEATIRHVMVGEGFHNYHHTYPWDYSASELGGTRVFNPATLIIDFFAFMGWAWDLKKVDPAIVRKRMQATGDTEARYPGTLIRAIREWICGLLVMLGPLYSMLTVKYVSLWVLGCLNSAGAVCEPRYQIHYGEYRLFEII